MMRPKAALRRWTSLLTVALLAGLVLPAGRAATIDAPETIGLNRLVMVSTPAEGTGFGWWVVGPRGVEQVVATTPDGHAIVFTGPAGEYTVLLSVFGADGSVDPGQAVVSIQEGDLPPTPTPTPTPAPAKVTHVYWLHETSEPTVDAVSAGVRDATAWRDAADAAGIKWLCLDDDAAEPVIPEVVAAARRTGLPQLAFVDVRGTVYLEKPPATIEAVVKLIRQYGGQTDASK